jgi:hypothetical protein
VGFLELLARTLHCTIIFFFFFMAWIKTELDLRVIHLPFYREGFVVKRHFKRDQEGKSLGKHDCS